MSKLIIGVAILAFSPLLSAGMMYNSCQGDHFTWADTTLYAYQGYACAPSESITLERVTVEAGAEAYITAPLVTLKPGTWIRYGGNVRIIGR